MEIKCIAFDLDNTLWECDPLIVKAEACFYQWLEKNCPTITNKMSEADLVRHRMDYMQSKPELHHNLTVLRKQWMREIIKQFVGEKPFENEASENEFVEEGFQVFWHQRNNVVFYEGVIAMLERLSKQYSLGVITNGNADVNYIGIGEYFDFSLSSGQAGVAKPHQDIFHQAMCLSGYALEETVYVGDDPKCDVIGPQRIGMRAIWYNPTLKPWPSGKTPAAIFQRHHELEDKIKKL